MTRDEVISSVDNPKVKAARQLGMRKHRRRQGMCLVEGPHLVGEALQAGVSVSTVFFQPDRADEEAGRLLDTARKRAVEVLAVSERVMASLSETSSPQGLVAVARVPSYRPEDVLRATNPLVVVMDGVQDPGNAGSMMRTACAMGASGVVAGSGADPFGPKSLRASMGATFRIPVVSAEDMGMCLGWLASRGLRLVAADPHRGTQCHEARLTGPLALIIGSEGSGLTPVAHSMAEDTVRVPMSGRAESLNVTAALAILLYEAWLQRSGAR
ncbi:MAG: RNA methyltransferase [Bacillota bacterium]